MTMEKIFCGGFGNGFQFFFVLRSFLSALCPEIQLFRAPSVKKSFVAVLHVSLAVKRTSREHSGLVANVERLHSSMYQ